MLLHMQTLDTMAGTAAAGAAVPDAASPVVHAAGALLLLLAAVALSIYKARGVTRYGSRQCR